MVADRGVSIKKKICIMDGMVPLETANARNGSPGIVQFLIYQRYWIARENISFAFYL